MALQIDSRKVKPGDTFYCIIGKEDDGHRYIEQAVENGASTIVHSRPVEDSYDGVKFIKVDDTIKSLCSDAPEYYGDPADHLTTFGATGTNGKTTICCLISEIYSRINGPCGYIGTIGATLGKNEYDVSLTTPDIITLQRTLSEMLDDGATAVALEVSAQGIDQNRTGSIDFNYLIYTNLTHEHLDYFGDMDNYLAAKRRLFEEASHDAVAILKADDMYFDDIYGACNCNVVTYGICDIDFKASEKYDYAAVDIEYMDGGMSFDLMHAGKSFKVTTNLTVEYNIYNLLAAAASLHESGLELAAICEHFRNIDWIPGRQTNIDLGQDFSVIVDYAHTPDSYEKILSFARSRVDARGSGRVITVSGAPGKRDETNRSLFAEYIGNYADTAILTADDPRDEDPDDISNEIAGNLPIGFDYIIISDREQAIRHAIENADTNDIILILGKGCETYQYVGTGKVDYVGDDKAAENALKES